MFYYLPTRHAGLGSDGGQTVIVRLKGQPEAQISSIVARARAAAPEIRFIDAFPLGTRIEPQLRAWRLGATLLTAFGILALVVAGSGLYSVLAFDVAQRRFELGLRSALGASAARLVRAIVTQVTFVVLFGIGVGVLAAVVLARLARSMLFGVAFVDPLSYTIAIAVLCAGSLVAIALPAWRATRVDPRVAMAVE
jgi:ABC-type antimicrobial peptide transport system permease subunit